MGAESRITVYKQQIFLAEVDIRKQLYGARAAEPELEIWLHESYSYRAVLGAKELKFRLPTSSQTSSRAESRMAQLCVKRPTYNPILLSSAFLSVYFL